MAVQPLVSVVIPNHNYGRYVGQAIESVLAQTYPHVEIVVIDNGSTDDSLEVLGAYGDKIHLIAQRDLGQSGGRNRGILEARGAWIAFLDADDVWLPDKLEAQLAVAGVAGDRLGLVYCSMQEVDVDLRPGRVLEAQFRGDVLREFVRKPGWAIVLGGESTALVRREALVRAGLFDPSLSIGAGWDLWRRIASLYTVDFVAEPLVLYRQHATNLHGKTEVYERDLRYMTAKMYADPLATDVRPYRRRNSAGIDVMLGKAWWRGGHRARGAGFILRGALRRPATLWEHIATQVELDD